MENSKFNRQLWLYVFLITQDENNATSLDCIIEKCRERILVKEPGEKIEFEPYHKQSFGDVGHDRCKELRDDIDAINNDHSGVFTSIIISPKPYFYKIATRDEVLEYVQRLYIKPALNKLRKCSSIMKKVNMQGQFDLLMNKFNDCFRECSTKLWLEGNKE